MALEEPSSAGTMATWMQEAAALLVVFPLLDAIPDGGAIPPDLPLAAGASAIVLLGFSLAIRAAGARPFDRARSLRLMQFLTALAFGILLATAANWVIRNHLEDFAFRQRDQARADADGGKTVAAPPTTSEARPPTGGYYILQGGVAPFGWQLVLPLVTALPQTSSESGQTSEKVRTAEAYYKEARRASIRAQAVFWLCLIVLLPSGFGSWWVRSVSGPSHYLDEFEDHLRLQSEKARAAPLLRDEFLTDPCPSIPNAARATRALLLDLLIHSKRVEEYQTPDGKQAVRLEG